MKTIDASTKKYPNTIVMVDDEDYEYLSKFKWSACKYKIYRRSKDKILLIHREIMNPIDGMVVDHIDGNILNNQKANLRICRQAENSYNKSTRKGVSKYIGVAKHRYTNKWRAYITKHKKQYHLGFFEDEVEAAKARDNAAIKYFGEFANLNFKYNIN